MCMSWGSVTPLEGSIVAVGVGVSRGRRWERALKIEVGEGEGNASAEESAVRESRWER